MCIRVYVYACIRANGRICCVYTPHTCTCLRICVCSPPVQILSLRVYNMPTMSAISRPHLLVVHSVYRLYPGKRVCAQCLQTMHGVYKLCTVSTNHAQCLQTMHSVYKLCTVSTCMQSVYRLYNAFSIHNVYMGTQAHIHTYIEMLFVYAYSYARVYTDTYAHVYT